MADMHQAKYRSEVPTRALALARLLGPFERHGLRFLGSVRGLHLDREADELLPDVTQEQERVADLETAAELSAGWPAACYDFRFTQWSFEVYLLSETAFATDYARVVLSFPNSVFRLANENAAIADAWLALLADVAVALGEAEMVCGPDVPLEPAESGPLEDFRHALQHRDRLGNFIHSAVIATERREALVADRSLDLSGFGIRPAGPRLDLWSLLPSELPVVAPRPEAVRSG